MSEELARKYFPHLFETYQFSVATFIRFPDFGNWAYGRAAGRSR